MRFALLGLSCVFLAGCPVYVKIYLHNDSDNSIHVESLLVQDRAATVPPGRTKTIQAGSVLNVCFELSAGSDVRIYSIDPNSGPYIRSAMYGGRLDLHFENDAMYIRSNTGERLEIPAQEQCVE